MLNSLKIRQDSASASDNGTQQVLCKVPEPLRRKIRIQADGCWIWTGNKFTTGYGCIPANFKLWKAHRYIWTLVNGPIPANLQCLHHCDVPLCVNPAHLFLGTDRDNHQDKAAKGRHWQQKKTHCPKGHVYTPENTYIPPSGGRKCKLCRAEQKRRAA